MTCYVRHPAVIPMYRSTPQAITGIFNCELTFGSRIGGALRVFPRIFGRRLVRASAPRAW